MNDALHIASGDVVGEILTTTGIPGDVLVWHDILYDGPRDPGWPDEKIIAARARFLERTTAGGLDRASILNTLQNQYARLTRASAYASIVLWFDACLFDQSMLAHILACMHHKGVRDVELSTKRPSAPRSNCCRASARAASVASMVFVQIR